MHQEECKLLRTSPIESGDFEDYDIITPLRVLIMKKTNPAAYKEINCLESNLDFKVCGLFLKNLFELVDLFLCSITVS